MYYVIVNPASKSGKGAGIWAQIEPILKEKEIEYKVFFSQEAGHVVKLVRDLSASLLESGSVDPLKLIILGGDGTINEALQGITDFKHAEVGYIPTGSSNDLARDLNIPISPVKALEQILSCQKPVPMDVGQLVYNHVVQPVPNQANTEPADHKYDYKYSHRYFIVSSGIGFDAAVCEEALTSKFKKVLNKIGLGKLTYLSIALKQLIKAQKITCDLTLDDKEKVHMSKFLFVACMNHQYEGGGFKFCPDADYRDGLLDICAVGNIPKWLVILALPTAFKGKHYRFQGIDHYMASKIHLETSSPLWVHTDGEVSARSSSITLTCEKEKLKFLM